MGALVSNSPKADRVEVEIECADLLLDITSASSLAMIVNEAVTNSLKYAFASGQPGTLRIKLSTAANECLLLISDNGPGFEQPMREGSLGMRLMKGMARQLEGRLSIDGSDGTTVSLRCPLRKSSASAGELTSHGLERPATVPQGATTAL